MKLPFYIAKRYLFSKNNPQSVSIILWISIGAFSFISASLFVVMSVFNGLREMNIQNLNQLNSDLKIESVEGKRIKNVDSVYSLLKNNPSVKNLSRVIDEKVYIKNGDKNQIAKIKGVDENFNKVIPVDSIVIYGKYPSFVYKNEMVVSNDLVYRLDISFGGNDEVELYVPRKGTGRIKNEQEAFVVRKVYSTGMFSDSYTNTIICPIEMVEELLESEVPIAYSIVLNLKSDVDKEKIQREIQEQLGKEYSVKNRYEQDEAFIKMMNVEQMMIYLIFALIILLSSFNLAGAIIVLIIDKSVQNQSLISMGFTKNKIRQVYFNLGVIISLLGASIGIVIGILVVFAQMRFSLIMANEYIAFPVKIEWYSFPLVVFSILFFGIIISWISSRKIGY